MATMSMPAARPVAMAAATTTRSGFSRSANPRMTMATPMSVSTMRPASLYPKRGFEAALQVRMAQRDAGLLEQLVVLDALGFLHEAHDAGTQHALRLLHADERRRGTCGQFRPQEQVGRGGRGG